jgi:DNA-binding transcriptional ArsR family regulator
MDRRTVLVVFLAVTTACSLVPIGGAATTSPDGAATAITVSGFDSTVTERFRSGTTSGVSARTDPDGVLEQPTRERIYTSVSESPGIGLGELIEAVPVAKSTVRYHLRILREAGLVESATVAGTLRFAPSEADAELAGALSAGPTRAVVDAVAEHEPASVTAIAEATDRAPSTVSHHLGRLEERGVVDRERVGEAVVTTLTAETRSTIESSGSLPADD